MKFFAIAAVATVSANQFDHMNEDELLVNLESTLSSALSSEARGDGDAAVAKTAAINNIQKALTARILKRLDDGQPLVEVARKMKAIRVCSHRSTIWREDSVSSIRRASPRERHQDPPKGRRCQRYGQEMSALMTPSVIPPTTYLS